MNIAANLQNWQVFHCSEGSILDAFQATIADDSDLEKKN